MWERGGMREREREKEAERKTHKQKQKELGRTWGIGSTESQTATVTDTDTDTDRRTDRGIDGDRERGTDVTEGLRLGRLNATPTPVERCFSSSFESLPLHNATRAAP